MVPAWLVHGVRLTSTPPPGVVSTLQPGDAVADRYAAQVGSAPHG